MACASAGVQAESLQAVTVTATPLGDTPLQSSQPVSVLRGAELDRRRAVSLGDTLDRVPGVTATGFGTAAGCPVIRGQSGPRVGITENGLDTLETDTADYTRLDADLTHGWAFRGAVCPGQRSGTDSPLLIR